MRNTIMAYLAAAAVMFSVDHFDMNTLSEQGGCRSL